MLEKYKNIFMECLELEEEEVETAAPGEIVNWDSLRHMNLVATLEDEFDIELEPDDVIEIDSFAKGIEILKKYGVKF